MTNTVKEASHRRLTARTRRRIATTGLALAAVLWLGMAAATSAQAQADFRSEVLYNFPFLTFPSGPLVADTQGNLYGSTEGGGSGYGTIFKLPIDGGETTLYAFTGGADGSSPTMAGLTEDTGVLYGVAPVGGNLVSTCVTTGCGVVFTINGSGTPREKVVYSFKGGADGSLPDSTLVLDASGNLYGTAAHGGMFNSPCNTYGCGVVFELSPAGQETVLYGFTGGADGAQPGPGLIRDSEGNLYGTTASGGTNGNGVVFKLDPTANETVLHSFTGKSDGSTPLFLVQDSAGNLYGDTANGGDTSCSMGCGVLFSIDSGRNERTVFSFKRANTGYYPMGSLILDGQGNLYGTTYRGGFLGGLCADAGCGIVFKITPAGAETALHGFNMSDGDQPDGGLLLYRESLYGTTINGGSSLGGVVYSISR